MHIKIGTTSDNLGAAGTFSCKPIVTGHTCLYNHENNLKPCKHVVWMILPRVFCLVLDLSFIKNQNTGVEIQQNFLEPVTILHLAAGS